MICHMRYTEPILCKAHLSRDVDFLQMYDVSMIYLFENVNFMLQHLDFRTSCLK